MVLGDPCSSQTPCVALGLANVISLIAQYNYGENIFFFTVGKFTSHFRVCLNSRIVSSFLSFTEYNWQFFFLTRDFHTSVIARFRWRQIPYIKQLKASVPSTSTGSLCARMDDVHMESNLTQNPSGASVFEKMFKKIKVDFNVFWHINDAI